jgi:hypothetical protein
VPLPFCNLTERSRLHVQQRGLGNPKKTEASVRHPEASPRCFWDGTQELGGPVWVYPANRTESASNCSKMLLTAIAGDEGRQLGRGIRRFYQWRVWRLKPGLLGVEFAPEAYFWSEYWHALER